MATKVFRSSLEGAIKAIAVSAFLTENSKGGKGGVPIMLLGNPGVAKSKFVETFCTLMGYRFLNIEAASRQPEDFMGYMTTPDTVGSSTVDASLILPDYYTKIKQWTDEKKKGILFFDEINTAPAHVQAVALGLIQERRFRDIELPNTVTIVAAGNFFENLNQDDMAPLAPVLNRFCILNINVEVSMSGNDDFSIMERLYDSINDNDHQFTWSEAYADVYSEMLANITEKALVEESEEDRVLRWRLEDLIAKECINTVRRMTEVDKSININDKRLSSLYTDAPTPNHDIYNFISPRSLDGLVKMAGGFYHLWGLESLTSNQFCEVINGLVGLSPAPRPSTKSSSTLDDVKFVLTGSAFYTAIKTACETFKLKSDKKIEKKLKIFGDFLKNAESEAAKSGGKRKGISLSQSVFNDLKEYFKTFSSDIKDVSKPIDEKNIAKMYQYIMNVPQIDDNYQLPVSTTGKMSTPFSTLDSEAKSKYINTEFSNDYKKWTEWWGVVREFVNTFGDRGYGYQGTLPVAELTRLQNRAITFFTQVMFEVTSDATIKNNLDVQVKPFAESLSSDQIMTDFSLNTDKVAWLFSNRPK